MKALIIGLDGASLDLLLPWVEAGYLPGFSRMIEKGGFGQLESVPNQRSAAAWTSFQTGTNPGKHGIFEFYERVPDTYDIKFVNARTRDGKSFFKIASEAGKRVVVINVPITYPAEVVNGAMIAGLDAPGKNSRGFSYPQGLIKELEAQAGDYIIEPGLTGCIVNGEIDKAIRLLFEEIESKRRASRFLLKKYPWDLFVTIFRSTDAAHHCFWKYHDAIHPKFNRAEAEKYGGVIVKAYQMIDEFIQEVLENLDPETMVLVISDHGCGPKHPASNQLNIWLESQGFLAYETKEPGTGSTITRMLAEIYTWTIAKTPRRTKEHLWRLFPQFRDRVQTRLCFSGIDWSQTRAFSDTLFPNIWINVKGREPLGIVDSQGEYDTVCAELTSALLMCQDEISGEPIVEAVLRRQDVYAGPHVGKAPDLLVRWREDIPIRGIRIPTPSGSKQTLAMERASTPFIPGEDYRIISGDHRLNGILLFLNPTKNAAGCQLKKASLMDIAPTVLYALGLPIPEVMDGKVLTGLFDEAYLQSHPIRFIQSENHAPSPPSDEKDYTVEDEQKVKERLRSLGYVE
jgi:predicted AlkP superfamily phosphohydrolase/phosphomutase